MSRWMIHDHRQVLTAWCCRSSTAPYRPHLGRAVHTTQKHGANRGFGKQKSLGWEAMLKCSMPTSRLKYSHANRKRTGYTQPRNQVGSIHIPTSVVATATTAGTTQSHHRMVPAHRLLVVYCHPLCGHCSCCLRHILSINISL